MKSHSKGFKSIGKLKSQKLEKTARTNNKTSLGRNAEIKLKIIKNTLGVSSKRKLRQIIFRAEVIDHICSWGKEMRRR